MKDFIREFLFGERVFSTDVGRAAAAMTMDAYKEGWLGIPHGGIGMGALLELAEAVNVPASGSKEALYPLCSAFRMGGAGVRVGDQVTLEARAGDGIITGAITVDGASAPYISAEIGFGGAGCPADGYGRDYIPETFEAMAGNLSHLPHYLNCFVCGVDRKLPGLKRRFHLWPSPGGPVACAFAGFNDEDRETFFRFERGGFVHPMAVTAVLDETMGWGGFFASGHGGVSVRLNYRILRKTGIGEKLVFFGRGEKVSGRIDKRMMFWASGAACVLKPDGSFEIVSESSGQWFAMAALTEEMRRELIPGDLTEAAFAVAEKSGDS